MVGERAGRTSRQLSGDAAEALTARLLSERGWKILGRNVHCGRSELDIVAVDPGPPARLVVVEVRYRRSSEFGSPEETFDRGKRASLRRGIGRLLDVATLPDGTPLPRLPLAVDLVAIEPGPKGSRVRLYRDVLPG